MGRSCRAEVSVGFARPVLQGPLGQKRLNGQPARGVGGTGVDANAVMEMGGSAVESARGSRATEATLRGFWTGYRALMGY